MPDLLVHPSTKEQLTRFIQQPSHALLLVGPSGSGKLTAAQQLAETILELPAGGFEHYGYGITIAPTDDKAIGVEAIRELEHFLSLKVPSKAANHRIVIIEAAHKLTIEAQNALLKTLEEPPNGTILVLTATSEQSLLPTIRSRAQILAVKRPLKDETIAYFLTQQYESEDIQQAYSISGGLPGLMSALLMQEEHPLRAATEQARLLLKQSTYERLIGVDALAKQKTFAQDTLFILQQMAHIALKTATSRTVKKWESILAASYQASEQLANSAQPKLVLTNFVLYL